MQAARRFKFDKLIRDNLVDRLRAMGITVFDRVMDLDEYTKRLKDKLLEEAHELCSAKSPKELTEEFADLMEVIATLALHHKISLNSIEKCRKQKKDDKGGFKNRIYVSAIQMDSNHPDLDQYLRRPEIYPELEPV